MVAVIIPLYKEYPTEFDLISLTQCFQILSNFPIVALKPKSLDLKNYGLNFSEVVSLNDENFQGIASYNKLMMSASFYERFLKYEYILVHQTDAFIFKDQLASWCKRGYDYIGAPWLRSHEYVDLTKKLKEGLKGYLYRKFNIREEGTDLPSLKQIENRVGNGGLSLRRTRRFYNLCKQYPSTVQAYLRRPEHLFNEDVFWSVEVNRHRRQLRIPSYKEAVFFSVESNPQRAIELTKGELPFGCHAWDLHLDFFRPYFKEYGFEI